MKKRISLFVIFLFLSGPTLFSQTARLPDITANPGEDISIPLVVTDFTNIGSIQLFIQIDTNILTFIGVTGQPAGMLTYRVGRTIRSVWTANQPPYLNIANGPLMNLLFTYNGPGSSPLTFDIPNCEVYQMPGFIPWNVTYTNGSVSPNGANTTKASLLGSCAVTGQPVAVPVKYEGFANNVGSIEQKIQYDPAKLAFSSVTMVGTLGGATVNATGGIITIVWSDPFGVSINYPANQFILNFTYTATTATDLVFYPGCVITTNGAVNIPVSYFNSSVVPNLVPLPPAVAVTDGCESSVLTASGVAGAAFLWSTGATTASITVNTAGAYTVTQSLGGCTSPAGTGTASPVFVPAPSVTVADSIGYSILTAGGFTGSLLWSTGASTVSITVTTAGTYSVTQTVNGCTSPAGSGYAEPLTGFTVSGQVKYDNQPQTPLNGVTVRLKNPVTGATIATATTNPGGSGEQGYYSFPGLAAGNYRLTATYDGPWGGNNATDALDVELNLIGLWPLANLRDTVADVTATGGITAGDAIKIKQRVVGIVTDYPAGDWKFTDTTFTVGSHATILLKALCTGDVNGSHQP